MKEPDLATGIVWYVVFVYSTVCHEAAHAWTGRQLGDNTAYLGGQVSLDPTPHVRREPIGMVVMPIVSYLANGWMIGWAHAPYDPHWALRNPRSKALVSMAGPAANLIIALLSAFLMVLGAKAGIFQPSGMDEAHIVTSNGGPAWQACAMVLSISVFLNTLLFFLNLIPLPPLDGSAIPLFFLKGSSAEKYLHTMWQPWLQIIGMVVVFKFGGLMIGPFMTPIFRALYSAMG